MLQRQTLRRNIKTLLYYIILLWIFVSRERGLGLIEMIVAAIAIVSSGVGMNGSHSDTHILRSEFLSPTFLYAPKGIAS